MFCASCMSLSFSRMDTLTLFLPPAWLTKSSCALIVFARFAAASRRNRIPTSALLERNESPATRKTAPQTKLPRLNFVFVSTDAMLRSGIVCVDDPSGITPSRVFGLLYITRMLLAATLVLSQNRTTDGLNRSPMTSVSPVA